MVIFEKMFTRLADFPTLLTPREYAPLYGGFSRDRENLQSDHRKIIDNINRNVGKYGESYTSQG